MPRRLLALDLDGTLLRTDGEVDARDASAVRRALGLGVAVTLATGRLATGALPSARALGIVSPLVCADGALLACGRTGCVLDGEPLGVALAESALGAMLEHALAPFVFAADAIHAEAAGPASWSPAGTTIHALLRPWTADVVVHERLRAATAWRSGPVAFALGVGPRERVEAGRSALERGGGGAVEAASFLLSGEAWALRVRPHGCDKRRMLERLAARLGVAREHVCAVGDWLNDIAMLAWAGQSYAMADAPEDVRRAARETLRARRGEGGGVAEAVDRWLGPRGQPGSLVR